MRARGRGALPVTTCMALLATHTVTSIFCLEDIMNQ